MTEGLYRFTPDQYVRIKEAGIFGTDAGHVELIDGMVYLNHDRAVSEKPERSTDYLLARLSAAQCNDPKHNCRVEWNEAHPDDQVSAAESETELRRW